MHAVTTSIASTQNKKRKADPSSSCSLDMSRVVCIILGGGQGKRLFPLTETTCKPAISFGGRYRLIDIPISNAIHARCQKIFVLTQFLSRAIHHHIFRTYTSDSTASKIEILPAEQKPQKSQWFQGTADAVRQNLEYLAETPGDYFLILSGDQIYNMDFRKMLGFAEETDAELVIATLPVDERDSKRFGILKVNQQNMVTDFYEKPQDPNTLSLFKAPNEVLSRANILPDSDRKYLGSMGIYLFKREALFKLLSEDTRDDFGQHLIPAQVAKGGVAAFLYDGYWEDIGTIESFYQANMALAQSEPAFNFYDEHNPIYSLREALPGTKITNTRIMHSVISEGSVIEAEEIVNSILGLRCVVKRGTTIKDSYIMGNDFYQPPVENIYRLPNNPCIGENCVIKRAILDKNVCLGKGVQLINKDRLTTYDSDYVFIRDGIIIVSRGAMLPDGYVL